MLHIGPLILLFSPSLLPSLSLPLLLSCPVLSIISPSFSRLWSCCSVLIVEALVQWAMKPLLLFPRCRAVSLHGWKLIWSPPDAYRWWNAPRNRSTNSSSAKTPLTPLNAANAAWQLLAATHAAGWKKGWKEEEDAIRWSNRQTGSKWPQTRKRTELTGGNWGGTFMLLYGNFTPYYCGTNWHNQQTGQSQRTSQSPGFLRSHPTASTRLYSSKKQTKTSCHWYHLNLKSHLNNKAKPYGFLWGVMPPAGKPQKPNHIIVRTSHIDETGAVGHWDFDAGSTRHLPPKARIQTSKPQLTR